MVVVFCLQSRQSVEQAVRVSVGIEYVVDTCFDRGVEADVVLGGRRLPQHQESAQLGHGSSGLQRAAELL